jgi:hypothetical protein
VSDHACMPAFTMVRRKLIYAGPTCASIPRELIASAGFELLPPAQRGDIPQALGGPPGIMVLVDGRFHQSLAVGHAELRSALDLGWELWGLSSMGAIRAYEMRHLGMRGFGRVYEFFLGEDDFQDDEVALLHAPVFPYFGITEPLIHLRQFVLQLERADIITHAQARTVVRKLKCLWFGERTRELTLELVSSVAGDSAKTIARAISSDFRPFEVKVLDLTTFLAESVWESDSYAPIPALAPYSELGLHTSMTDGVPTSLVNAHGVDIAASSPNADVRI